MFRHIPVLSVCFFLLCGCNSPGETNMSTIEIARVGSPDSIVDAVMTRRNPHGTVSYVFEIFIAARGSQPDSTGLVLRADKLEDVRLVWRQPRFLEVHYKSGRIFQFINFWQSRYVQNFAYIVEIRLKPGSESFTLSSLLSRFSSHGWSAA